MRIRRKLRALKRVHPSPEDIRSPAQIAAENSAPSTRKDKDKLAVLRMETLKQLYNDSLTADGAEGDGGRKTSGLINSTWVGLLHPSDAIVYNSGDSSCSDEERRDLIRMQKELRGMPEEEEECGEAAGDGGGDAWGGKQEYDAKQLAKMQMEQVNCLFDTIRGQTKESRTAFATSTTTSRSPAAVKGKSDKGTSKASDGLEGKAFTGWENGNAKVSSSNDMSSEEVISKKEKKVFFKDYVKSSDSKAKTSKPVGDDKHCIELSSGEDMPSKMKSPAVNPVTTSDAGSQGDDSDSDFSIGSIVEILSDDDNDNEDEECEVDNLRRGDKDSSEGDRARCKKAEEKRLKVQRYLEAEQACREEAETADDDDQAGDTCDLDSEQETSEIDISADETPFEQRIKDDELLFENMKVDSYCK